MTFRCRTALVLAVGALLALTAEAAPAGGHEPAAVIVVPAGAEAEDSGWKPFSAVKRSGEKVTGAARKIGRRIGAALSSVFGDGPQAPAPRPEPQRPKPKSAAQPLPSDADPPRLAAKEAAPAKVTRRCEEAKASVSNYAFSDVETVSCEGTVYQFSGLRGGRRFLVKVSAANGDLVAVDKLDPPPATEARAP